MNPKAPPNKWPRSGTRRRIATALLVILLAALAAPAQGQTPAQEWALTTNLSRSGSAAEPVLVLGPEGNMQAFWWDRFDGLMTAAMDGIAWQPATLANLLVPDPRAIAPVDAEEPPALIPIGAMPQMVADGQGTIHAFWLVERGGFAARTTDPVPAVPSLAHASSPMGASDWSQPELLVEGALTWHVFADPEGGLHLAYVRTLHSAEQPAGVYYTRLYGEPLQWEPPRLAQASIYARLLSSDEARVAGVADATGAVVLAWRDPRMGEPTYLRSDDGGESWRTTAAPLEHASHPTLAYLGPGRLVAVWEVGLSDNQVSHYQQVSTDAGLIWGEPRWVPREAARYGTPALRQAGSAGDAWLVSGEGGPYLSLCRWRPDPSTDADQGEWSLANTVAVNIHDAETDRTVSLEEIRVAVDDRWLHLIGRGQDGEVWAMRRETGGIAWAFSSDTPWTEPLAIWEDNTGADMPAVVGDAAGTVHAWWIAASDVGRSGVALWYAQRTGDEWAPATAVFALEEQAQHPTATLVESRVHLLWTSGRVGTIGHSSVFQDRAATASEWATIRRLPLPAEAGGASSPQMIADGAGGLHVIYAVPLNESRGIYYVHSEDGGNSWSEPLTVVHAAKAGWPSVDAPDLAIAEDGSLWATWIRVPLTDGHGEAVYLANSTNGGSTWSPPLLVSEGPCSEPRLALLGQADIHLFWIDESDARVWSYRRSADGGTAWTPIETVPGMSSLQGSPDLAYDARGSIHLTGVSYEASDGWLVRHASWDAGSSAWSEVGRFRLSALYRPRGGVSLALLPERGRLHALLAAESTDADADPALLHAYRAVTPTEPHRPVVVRSAASDAAAVEPTLPAPQPTAWGPTEPPPATGTGIALGPFFLPMTGVLGIVVAAAVVLAVALVYSLRPGRQWRSWTRSR